MPRYRKSGKGLPNGVYWQSGAWRYKAKNAVEKANLGKLWTRLGKTEEHVHQNYWDMVGSKINAKGGMLALWEKFKKDVLPGQAARTARDNEKMWQILKPMVEHSHPSQITRAWAVEYLIARGLKGIQGKEKVFKPAPSRAKKEFALLRHMLNCALDWDIIDRNPLLGVKVESYLKTDIRDRVPEEWELIAVQKHGDLQVKLFIDFKYMTGFDQSTCFSLLIPSFDGPGLPVKRSKTNKKGFVEWSDELIDVIRELIALNNNRSTTLFCNSRGQKVTVGGFAQKFKRAVNRAIRAGDLAERFTANDIRSAHGTDAEEKHGLDASKQLLNSPAAKKHYVHKRKGEKITALPRLKKK